MSCVSFKEYGDLNVIKKCPDAWQDAEVKIRCENPYSIVDPMGLLPVTNLDVGITFGNLYCALCNDDAGQKAVKFDPVQLFKV